MKTLKLILLKELKSMIRDPKILIAMIIVPIILTGAIYGVMIGATRQVAREAVTMRGVVALYDMDHGNWSRYVVEYMEKLGLTVIKVYDEEKLLQLVTNNKTVLGGIVIPEGFTENITEMKPARIDVYTVIRSINILSLTRIGKLIGLVNSIGQNISSTIILEKGVNREFLRRGIRGNGILVLRNRIVEGVRPEILYGPLVIVSMFIPLIVLILSSFIAQLSATSIAVEKEEKMLETLLSLPLSRLQLIGGKILAATIIGFIGLILYGGVFAWYFSAISSPTTGGINTTGMGSVNVFGIITDMLGGSIITSMIISLIGVVLFVLALAILLALFVEDVRSAQIISGYIVMPLAIAVFLALFIDPSGMDQGGRIILSVIPLVNVGFIVNMGFIGDYVSLSLIPISNLVYATIMMYIASRIISTEKVFTMRMFRRRKRRI